MRTAGALDQAIRLDAHLEDEYGTFLFERNDRRQLAGRLESTLRDGFRLSEHQDEGHSHWTPSKFKVIERLVETVSNMQDLARCYLLARQKMHQSRSRLTGPELIVGSKKRKVARTLVRTFSSIYNLVILTNLIRAAIQNMQADGQPVVLRGQQMSYHLIVLTCVKLFSCYLGSQDVDLREIQAEAGSKSTLALVRTTLRLETFLGLFMSSSSLNRLAQLGLYYTFGWQELGALELCMSLMSCFVQIIQDSLVLIRVTDSKRQLLLVDMVVVKLTIITTLIHLDKYYTANKSEDCAKLSVGLCLLFASLYTNYNGYYVASLEE